MNPKKSDLKNIENKNVLEKSAEDEVVSEIEADILETPKAPTVSDVVSKTLAKVKGLDKSKNV